MNRILSIAFLLLSISQGEAQSVQFVQSINFYRPNFTLKSNDIKLDKFNSTGYSFGIEFHHPSKKHQFNRQLYVLFLQFNTEYTHFPGIAPYQFNQSIKINTHYLVFGWRPITIELWDEKVELSIGIEQYIRLKENSSYQTARIVDAFGDLMLMEKLGYDATNRTATGLDLTGAYLFDLGSNIQLVPRVTFRFTTLTDRISDSNLIYGLEMGMRYYFND